jgi:hypothetical protein
VAVLSADLVSLTQPQRQKWYRWRDVEDEGIAIAEGLDDLAKVGLPWLEAHLEAKRLTEALEAKASASSRPDSNSLMFLSHGYEARGEIMKALEAWRRYRGTLDRLAEGSDLALRIAARDRALTSKLSEA